MNDREIMQQALDALNSPNFGVHSRAILALQERLAHCDRCGKKMGGEGDIHTCTPDPIGDAQDRLIAEMAAQPEQEPVAEVVWGAKTGFEWKFKMLVELACVEDVPVKLYAGPFSGVALYWHDTETVAQPEQKQWDAIPDAFNEWWDADYDDTGNPYRKDSPAYWAWAGWSAAIKEKNT